MNAEAAIRDQGIIAIVRAKTAEAAVANVHTLVMSGLRAVEVSLVTPDALDVIRHAQRECGARAAIGVGTAMSARDVEQAVEAGASFVVAPTTREDVIRAAVHAGVAVLPGAATPTEAMQAVEWGATFVKLFPASLWSPDALRDVLAALPQLLAVPTGGVNIENAADWIRAGAVALGVGSALTSAGDPRLLVQRMLEAVAAARS